MIHDAYPYQRADIAFPEQYPASPCGCPKCKRAQNTGLGFLSAPQAITEDLDWRWIVIAALVAWILYREMSNRTAQPAGATVRRKKD